MRGAIIVGTGIGKIGGLEFEPRTIQTAYGEAFVNIGVGEADGLVWLARHGAEHEIPPHQINFRANLKALQMLGVKLILASNAVGSISRQMPPGSLMLLDDFLDFTSGRPLSFYDGGKTGVVHADMNAPYCSSLRGALLNLAPQFGLHISPQATYVATNGPRFETPAEIRMYAKLGGDVVGMTGVPEVVLARELGMHYAAAAFSINWAAGLEEKMEFVGDKMSESLDKMIALMVKTLQEPVSMDCNCASSLTVMYPPEN